MLVLTKLKNCAFCNKKQRVLTQKAVLVVTTLCNKKQRVNACFMTSNYVWIISCWQELALVWSSSIPKYRGLIKLSLNSIVARNSSGFGKTVSVWYTCTYLIGRVLIVLDIIAGGLRRVATKGRGAGRFCNGKTSPSKSPPAHIAFLLFLCLSSAKIQYSTQTDIALESTRPPAMQATDVTEVDRPMIYQSLHIYCCLYIQYTSHIYIYIHVRTIYIYIYIYVFAIL